jgi:phenylacetate-CoA ligase
MLLQKELFYGGRALLRDGWVCRRLLGALRKNEVLSEDEMEMLRLKLLHRTLQHAISSLPYYESIPSDFSVLQSVRVLKEQFPIVDKAVLLQNRSRLYPNGGKPRIWQPLGQTSGTTGTPLTVFRSLGSVLWENAFIKRHWSWSGHHDGMRRATLREELPIPAWRTEPPFWYWNRYNNQLLLSSLHLKDGCVSKIIDKLNRFNPTMLQAFPSMAFSLATHLKRRDRYLDIPFVFTASESLYPHQRELIKERLRTKVVDMYGMAERVAFATECAFGEMHVNSDYSYVEIVDDNGLPTDDYGHVVGTTFHNLAMPLVRHKLSDHTRWKQGACRCGSSFPMIEPVSGRLEDTIFGADGAVVSSFLSLAFNGVENIKKSQVAQTARLQWQIRLVPTDQFNEQDKKKLIGNINRVINPKVALEVVLMKDIPNEKSGKFRWVVNEMKDKGASLDWLLTGPR